MTSHMINLIPDEWRSAGSTYAEAWRVVRGTHRAAFRHVLGFLLPFGVGGLVGAWTATYLIAIEGDGALHVARGVLTFAGVLTGFMFTVILFTGRVDQVYSLTYEQARDYRAKVIYLVWSQIVTLTNHLLTAISALALLIALSIGVSSTVIWFLCVMTSAFFAVSFLRTLLLPWQVFEIHQFGLDRLVDHKEDEINKPIRERQR